MQGIKSILNSWCDFMWIMLLLTTGGKGG